MVERIVALYNAHPVPAIVLAICFTAMAIMISVLLAPAVKSLYQRIKRRYTNPFEVLAKIQDWQQLGKEIARFKTVEDGITNIVPFFNLVSPYFDRQHELREIIDYLQQFHKRPGVKDLIVLLRTLNNLIGTCGRERYGWNRTEPGQIVTEDNVFLGDIYGLFTHPVAYWKKTKDDPKGGWKGGLYDGLRAVEGRNCYDVISEQALGLIRPYAKKISAINELIFGAALLA